MSADGGTKTFEIMKAINPDFIAGGPGSLPAHYDSSVYQSTHNTGGAIMGADPATSVVNSYLQMWDAPNVFVVGASNFPQNAGFNPTGTVGALAHRAAEGILKFHKAARLGSCPASCSRAGRGSPCATARSSRTPTTRTRSAPTRRCRRVTTS